MLRVLFLMLILLAGLIAGPYLAGKQGYVLIETTNYSIEMSITTLVIFFVIALAIIYLAEWVITRFSRLSSNTYSWFSRRKRKKAQRQTLEGLIRMDEGDYAKAEKLIGKSAKHSDEPILNFVKAAEAAQQKGDEFAANNYLIQATELAGSDNLMLEIARTRIMLMQNKFPAARSSIDSLLEMAPKNTEVLRLAVEIYSKSESYRTLDDILPRVENAQIYSNQDFDKLEQQTINGLLDEEMKENGQDGMLNWWQQQSRQRRNNSYVKLALITRLIDCNDQESAYKLSLELLKKLNDDSPEITPLLKQICKLQPVDNKLLKILEKRLKQANATTIKCEYYRALGYLYAKLGQFDKADNAFKQLIEQEYCTLENSDITMATYVFEQTKDTVAFQLLQQQNLKTILPMTTNHSEASEIQNIDK